MRMEDVFDKFVQERVPRYKGRTQKEYPRTINGVLKERFGKRSIKDITQPDLKSFMAVDKGKTNRSRQLSVLSSVFDAAIEWGYVDFNPCHGIKRHKQQKRTRIVTDKELRGLIASIAPDKPVALALSLARLTGLKQGMILNLTWRQVKESERVIRTLNPITNIGEETEITPEVQAVLDRCKQRIAALGFKNKDNVVIPNRNDVAFSEQGFRTRWQETIKQWVRDGNTKFDFNDIHRTWDLEQKKAKAQPAPTVSILDQYPQFDRLVGRQATDMSNQYILFFCLEQSIRKLVTSRLQAAEGNNWWNTARVKTEVRKAANGIFEREVDSAMRGRSSPVDYTTFGQIKEIILENWTFFNDDFTSRKAFDKVMTDLNTLRGPIAHCCPYSSNEADKLSHAIKTWFYVSKIT